MHSAVTSMPAAHPPTHQPTRKRVPRRPCRYLLYGDVTARAAAELRRPEVADHFARLIQRVAPKSHAQALGEVVVTRKFLENFSGDQVGRGSLFLLLLGALLGEVTVTRKFLENFPGDQVGGGLHVNLHILTVSI
jgi:hypothetical protein